MKLLLLHPAVAFRDCADCLVHLYDEKTGEVVNGRTGQPRKRDKTCPAPCRKDPAKGCPKGTAENPKELNSQSLAAYEHYLRCRAVGRFPEDAIVERNAAIIRGVEDLVKSKREIDFQSIVMLAVSGASAGIPTGGAARKR